MLEDYIIFGDKVMRQSFFAALHSVSLFAHEKLAEVNEKLHLSVL